MNISMRMSILAKRGKMSIKKVKCFMWAVDIDYFILYVIIVTYKINYVINNCKMSVSVTYRDIPY